MLRYGPAKIGKEVAIAWNRMCIDFGLKNGIDYVIKYSTYIF